MLEENMKRNGGVVKPDVSDDYYDVLVKPKKSMKGVIPDPSEWQFDHIKPKVERIAIQTVRIHQENYNREKWNK